MSPEFLRQRAACPKAAATSSPEEPYPGNLVVRIRERGAGQRASLPRPLNGLHYFAGKIPIAATPSAMLKTLRCLRCWPVGSPRG